MIQLVFIKTNFKKLNIFHCVKERERHYYCAVITIFSLFFFRFKLLLAKSKGIDDINENGEILPKQFDSMVCYICNDKNATVLCSTRDCQRAFHLVCGDKSHCLMKFVEPFDAYCDEHHGKVKRAFFIMIIILIDKS